MITTKGKYLYKDGKRFFYLADTCWSGFTSIEMPDWKYYLDTRKREGFNAIQINVLRQYDSTAPIDEREPFPIVYHDDGNYEYDYTKPNQAYFDNAKKMLEEMVKRDMVPVLVLLWGNFVPGTWMNDNKNPFLSRVHKPQIMPYEQLHDYISYVVNTFKEFNPIYFVSGDVGFDDTEDQQPEKTIKYYREVLKVAKEADPDGVFTFHINDKAKTMPEDFLNDTNMYCYQSGHGIANQANAYLVPEKMRKEGYKKPIIDAELCYEGLDKFGAKQPAKYSAYEVREAAWRAVLSGSDAGLGYGSYGIWPWNDNYREGQQMTGFLKPYDWRECLKFRGAEDMGFLKDTVLCYGADGLNPVDSSLLESPTIRAAENSDYLLVYNPVANPVDLSKLNVKDGQCKVVDLQTLRPREGSIKNGIVAMEPVVEDELIVIKK